MLEILVKINGRKIIGLLLIMLICTLAAVPQARSADEGNAASGTGLLPPGGATSLRFVQTDSPRDTLLSFLRLAEELENDMQSFPEDGRLGVSELVKPTGSQFLQLFDLSSVPRVLQREVGIETLGYLLDIVGRLDLPPIEKIPGADAFEGDASPAKWRIPGSPIWIAETEDGPREGEFLFSQRAVSDAPEFYRQIRHLPLRSSIGITSWTEVIPQWHGSMIPSGLVAALPDGLKSTWLGAPIWKILSTLILTVLFVLLLVVWHRFAYLPGAGNSLVGRLRRISTPIVLSVFVAIFLHITLTQINMAGTFARAIGFSGTLVIFLAATWIFWNLVLIFGEWIILSPRIPDESLDANVIRLSARVIGFLGGVVIVTYGASRLGFPVIGVVTGLGVGGLAVALAIRPTLENLIGGLILFIDKPVRLGDFCSYGDKMGTVEHIGIRSTQIRALDRTMVSIPNSIFVDMEIVNWAKCDQMLIHTTIGLRYETEPDQLRFVLAKLREMLQAHPRIDPGSVRVRFAGYGASSLDVEIRVYASTREWNDFFAIREDVYLRVNEIVENSGTQFAFPSQTLYMSRDSGLDKARSETAKQQVKSWRGSGQLPFPNLPTSKVDQLAGTLDYPPRGSPDAGASEAQEREAAEPLSVDEHEEEDTEKSESEPR